MQPATYGAGVRQPYEQLPQAVHRWVEAQLGGPVVGVQNVHGGFSPGVAAAVTSAAGRRVFVKAVGSSVNADALRFYRAEREIALRLPAVEGVLAPLAWTEVVVAGETFVVLLFPALDGGTPAHPWTRTDLSRVLTDLRRLSARLTPSPWSADQRDDGLVAFLRGWHRVAADPSDPWRSHPWAEPQLAALVAAEDGLAAALVGDTLSHVDLRADNLVLTSERVWFVDWAHAQNAAGWVDAALLIGDVIASRADLDDGGEVDVVGTIHTEPLLSVAGTDLVWRLLLVLAGTLHALARTPSPPGLPTIRRWQHETAETTLAWCLRSERLLR